MLHLDDFAHQGSTSAHAWEHLLASKSGVHPGAAERRAIRRTELEHEAASSRAPAFSLAPYVPGMACACDYAARSGAAEPAPVMPRTA